MLTRWKTSLHLQRNASSSCASESRSALKYVKYKGGESHACGARQGNTLDDVLQCYEHLRTAKTNKVDIVHMDCPHLTYEEIRQIARAIKGKKVHPEVMMWVQTDTPSYNMSSQRDDSETEVRRQMPGSGNRTGRYETALGKRQMASLTRQCPARPATG